MTLTTSELADKIAEQVDEVDLIDLLGLTTQEIVQAFLWKVEEKAETIIEQLEL